MRTTVNKYLYFYVYIRRPCLFFLLHDHYLFLPPRAFVKVTLLDTVPALKCADWGVEGGGPCRFVTLLMYLNEPTAGGQTAFPKATDPATGKAGLAIHPGKGSAVLFYNLLPDGNADTETLHAALPVIEGEKWLANFWIWDPVMTQDKF